MRLQDACLKACHKAFKPGDKVKLILPCLTKDGSYLSFDKIYTVGKHAGYIDLFIREENDAWLANRFVKVDE